MCLAVMIDSYHSSGGSGSNSTVVFVIMFSHCQSLSSWIPWHVLHWWLCCITTGAVGASFSSVMPLTVIAYTLHGEMDPVGWICCMLLRFASFGGRCLLIIFSGFNFSRVPCVGNRDFCLRIWVFCCSLRKSSFSNCCINISIASYLMNMFHSSAAIVVFSPLKNARF